VGVTRAEYCVIACAEAWRGDGEVLASPMGLIPSVGARLAKRTFSPDLLLTDGEAMIVGLDGTPEGWLPYRLHLAMVTGGRLAGVAPPALPAVDDTSFAAAKSRVETALAFVKSLPRAQVDGAEDKVIAWSAGGNDRKIKGNDYVQQFGLPNFFFFVTTAYDILRHRGVPLGKRDFLGPVNWL